MDVHRRGLAKDSRRDSGVKQGCLRLILADAFFLDISLATVSLSKLQALACGLGLL